MLKIGDKVKFLNAVGGGKVTGFITPKMVNVEDDQGFETPFLITELVKDERYREILEKPVVKEKKPVKQEVVKPKKESQPLFASSAGKPATTGPTFFLAFVPEVPTLPLSGQIKAWLVNDSKFSLLFNFSLFTEEGYQSEKTGKLAPFSRIPIKAFGLEDFSNFPKFGFQLLPFENKSSRLQPALVKTLKVDPVKMYKESSFIPNAYFENRAMLVEIREKDLSQELEKLQQHDFNAPEVMKESGDIRQEKPKRKEQPEIREVDLHIGELVESSSGLSNIEMLDIQMERFRSEMETAIRNGTRRIVFIHGRGQGTLKAEIKRELGIKYKKYDVQDGSFREYGYGATMVILRKG